MDLLAIHMPSFVKCLFKSFVPFLLGYLSYYIVLYILDISPLFDTWIANMFPKFIGFYISHVFLSTAVILFNGQMVLFFFLIN